MASLCTYLEASAARFPDHVAVVEEDGRELSYAELDSRAARIAGFLIERGVHQGDRVALVLPKSSITLTAIFGILKAGGAYVPIDYSAPVERIRTILNDCGVKLLFAQAGPILEDCIADGRDAVLVPGGAETSAEVFEWRQVLEHAPIGNGAVSTGPDDLAYILYTSGSTGIPKGVMLTHLNATSYVDWCSEVFEPTENDRFSSHAPFHFDLSILDIYVAVKHAASIHLIPNELGKNPRDLARFIAERRLTVWYSTPSILALLARFGDLQKQDFRSLRFVLFAGEVFPVGQLRQLTKQWSWPEYYNLYGPTETNVCTYARIPLPISDDRTQPYPIGWQCSHCEALVIDTDGNEADEGLLYIAGPSVFRGYWGRAKESAAVFMDRDGKRWYNTGDVVEKHPVDGFIYIGRRDRMVKRRGYRIELGEIESCLHRYPGIQEVGAIANSHPENGVRITAFLSSGGAPPSVIEMKRFCHEHLPDYMNPDAFVFLPQLPRTSTAKVDYQALSRSLAEPVSAGSSASQT